jgi:hypothetical protein
MVAIPLPDGVLGEVARAEDELRWRGATVEAVGAHLAT